MYSGTKDTLEPAISSTIASSSRRSKNDCIIAMGNDNLETVLSREERMVLYIGGSTVYMT